jgi:NADH-quinone oxidoreductase subunit K
MPLWTYLVVASALFCIGAFGVLARRNAIVILMSVELMLNAVNINLVAFWRYNAPQDMAGQIFAAFVIVVAAAEAAVGLAIIIAVYRQYSSIVVEEVDALRG